MGGFTNITAPNTASGPGDPTNTFDVAFLTRDAAGLVFTPSANTSLTGSTDGCILVGVQTSNIQGFLSQSSCFIATAAFRSIDASPVAMLRQFRDQVLFKSELGTSFVHWYYHWSPPAAEWLMLHPMVRYPVLEALVPVEVTAWFVLHPMQLTLLVVFMASALALGFLFAFLMKAKGRVEG